MRKDILYPLRRMHGYICEKAYICKKKKAIFTAVLSGNRKKVVLLGTPTHTNIGDSAITCAEYEFLEKCGVQRSDIVELSRKDLMDLNYSVRKALKKCSLVCWHGGGNMGTLWPNEEISRRRGLKKIPPPFPTIIFPQTIFYDKTEAGEKEKNKSVSVYNGRPGLTIAAREIQSHQTMLNLYPDSKILLIPDIVLSTTKEMFGVKQSDRGGVLLCMRSDLERTMSDELRQSVEQAVIAAGESFYYSDMHATCPANKQNRADLVKAKMEEMASARLVITDRLHGMIFAAITETPCIVFSNNHHKVQGTYEWIKYLPYIRYVETEEDMKQALPELLRMSDCHFDNTPLQPYFQELAQVVKQYVNH